MRSIENAKKVTGCVNEILDVLAKHGLSDEEIMAVLHTTEESLGLHKPPMGPHPPMGHGPIDRPPFPKEMK